MKKSYKSCCQGNARLEAIHGEITHLYTTGVKLDLKTIVQFIMDFMKYTSVIEMLKDMDADWEEIEEYIKARKVVKRLKILRVTQGLSQQEIADKMDCNVVFVNRIEEGRDGDLRVSDLKRYLDALGKVIEIL